jgi:MFS family permease
LIGAVAFVLALPLMAFAPSFAILLASILLLQLASNTVQGPLQALVADYLPSTLWGRAAGLKAVFEVAGIVIGAYVSGQLVAANRVLGAYALVGGVFILAALLTFVGLRGARRLTHPAEDPPPPEGEVDFSGLKTVLNPVLRPFLWWLVNRYFFIVGLTTIRVFGFYFVQDYLHLPEPAAVVGNLVASIGLVVLFVALPAGTLADRVGRRRLMLGASVLATVAAPLFLLAHTATHLLLFGALIGVAAAIFQSVGWAMAMDLVPSAQVGRYLGLSNIATAGGSLSARLAGPMIDALNAQQFGLGYTALFLLNTVCFALTGLALLRIRYIDD